MDARDLKLLYDNRIAAVVDLAANESPAQLAREMIYCRVPILDGDGNADFIIETAIKTVVNLVENRIRTLVACSAGMSRAPSVAAVSTAIVTGRDPDDCLVEIIANAPNDVSPILWSRVKSVYNQIVTDGDCNVTPNVTEQHDARERRS